MALMDTWSFGLGVVVLEGRRHLERTVVSWLTNMNSIFFGQTSFIVHISNPILLCTPHCYLHSLILIPSPHLPRLVNGFVAGRGRCVDSCL
jgi:hypothetical protein